MGASPVAVLAIIAIYVAFYGVYMGTDGETGACGTNHTASCNLSVAPTVSQPGGSIWDTLTGVLNSIWTVVTLIAGAITFNVPGAPVFIQVPVAIIIISSLTWSIATLIRGN